MGMMRAQRACLLNVLVLVPKPAVFNDVQRLLRHGAQTPRGVAGAEAVGEREDSRLTLID